MKIYLAHPITGMSASEIFGYYSKLVEDLHFAYEVLHPMIGKDALRNEKKFAAEGYVHLPVSTDNAIKERDKWMVNQADVVLVDFTGASAASIGCCMELAWADQLGKHTVVVLDKDGIHNHAFVKACADILMPTRDEAVDYLLDLCDPVVIK